MESRNNSKRWERQHGYLLLLPSHDNQAQDIFPASTGATQDSHKANNHIFAISLAGPFGQGSSRMQS